MPMKLVPIDGGGWTYFYENDVGPSPPPSYGPSYQDPGKGNNYDPGPANWYDQGRVGYSGGTIPRSVPIEDGSYVGTYPPGYSGGTVPRNPYDPYSTYTEPGRPTPQQQYANGGGARAQQATQAPPMQNAQAASGYQAPYAQGYAPPDFSFGTSGPQQNPYIQASTGPRQPNPNAYLPPPSPRNQESGIGGVLDAFYGQGETNYGAPVRFQNPQTTSAASRQQIQAEQRRRAGDGSQSYRIGTGNMASNGRRPPGSGPIGNVNMQAVGAFMQLPPEQQAMLRSQGIGVTVNGQDPNTGAAPWAVTGGYNNPSGPTGKMQQLGAANQRAAVGRAMNTPQVQAPTQGGFPMAGMSNPGRYGNRFDTNRFAQKNIAMASSNAQTRAGADQLLQSAAATGNMDRSKPMLAQYYGSKNFARSQALADQQDRDRNYGLQRDALDFNQMQALAQAQAQTQAQWRDFL